MTMGIDGLAVLIQSRLLAAFAMLAGIPTLLLIFGVRRFKRSRSPPAKAMIGIGASIWLAYFSAIIVHMVWVAPYRSGIVSQGKSPDGLEYCIVQTYKTLGLYLNPIKSVSTSVTRTACGVGVILHTKTMHGEQ